MNEKQQNETTIVTGVIGEDVHITGIRILEHALRHEGFIVYSLGIHNSQEDFIREALRAEADAVLISSLAGHGELLLKGFKERCHKAGLHNVLFYIGGQLVIHEEEWSVTEKNYCSLGFNRVFKPFTLPGEVIKDLILDLGLEKTAEVSA